MDKFNRIIIMILDSVGCGARPDYKKFHREKRNTLWSVYNKNKNLKLPNLERLGLKKILFRTNPRGVFCAGKMSSKTSGNDTVCAIWEMLGVIINNRFKGEVDGLNQKNLSMLEKHLGTVVVGNEYITGVDAINKYYRNHEESGGPILYFADDGAVLLAAHEKIINPKKLYELGIMTATFFKKRGAARIIVRPFTGTPGNFVRVEEKRKDFVITKSHADHSIINNLKDKGIKFITTQHINTLLGEPSGAKVLKGNHNNKKLIGLIKNELTTNNSPSVMLFCLQDFDIMGHRHDVFAYGYKLKELDHLLPSIQKKLRPNDLLIITADHGSDPTYDIRGHTREYVPLLVLSKNNRKKVWLGTRKTYADIAQTICYNYNLTPSKIGKTLEIF